MFKKLIIIAVAILFVPIISLSQTGQEDLVGMPLDDAQTLLEKRGYEIAGSSLFKKEQLWYSEKENSCIIIRFKKKGDNAVTEVALGDEAKCKAGIEAAHKVIDSYHDGPAPANAAAIEKEREKLRAKGFVVSYWIKDIAPGRSTEYWKNDETGECKHIVWNTADQSDVSSSSCDSKYRNNPYPNE